MILDILQIFDLTLNFFLDLWGWSLSHFILLIKILGVFNLASIIVVSLSTPRPLDNIRSLINIIIVILVVLGEWLFICWESSSLWLILEILLGLHELTTGLWSRPKVVVKHFDIYLYIIGRVIPMHVCLLTKILSPIFILGRILWLTIDPCIHRLVSLILIESRRQAFLIWWMLLEKVHLFNRTSRAVI